MGTKDGEILEVGEKNAASNLLIDCHMEGEIWGLATHPSKDIFISASNDGTARIWDLCDKVSITKCVIRNDHFIQPCIFPIVQCASYVCTFKQPWKENSVSLLFQRGSFVFLLWWRCQKSQSFVR